MRIDRKIMAGAVIVFSTSCQTDITLKEDMAEAQKASNQICRIDSLPEEIRQPNSCIYVLNAGCSVCIGQYAEFMMSGKDGIKTSDLVILVEEEPDSMVIKYYEKKLGLPIPPNRQFVFDTTAKIAERTWNMVGINNVILTDTASVIGVFNTAEYKYDETHGLHRAKE